MNAERKSEEGSWVFDLVREKIKVLESGEWQKGITQLVVLVQIDAGSHLKDSEGGIGECGRLNGIDQ